MVPLFGRGVAELGIILARAVQFIDTTRRRLLDGANPANAPWLTAQRIPQYTKPGPDMHGSLSMGLYRWDPHDVSAKASSAAAI